MGKETCETVGTVSKRNGEEYIWERMSANTSRANENIKNEDEESRKRNSGSKSRVTENSGKQNNRKRN